MGTLKKYEEKPPIMTVESLLDYGFKEYPTNDHEKFDRNWQFCKRDQKGKKLYVQVRLWGFSKYTTVDRIVHDSFDADVQFDMNGPKTFNVTISVNDMTPSQVVDWFDRMHDKMGCVHYELYEDDEEMNPSQCECGKFLPPEDAMSPFLCSRCKYEKESGFKPVIRKTRIKRK